MADDTVLTFKGEPTTELSRQELLAALDWAYQEIKYQRDRADRYLQGTVPPPGPVRPSCYSSYESKPSAQIR